MSQLECVHTHMTLLCSSHTTVDLRGNFVRWRTYTCYVAHQQLHRAGFYSTSQSMLISVVFVIDKLAGTAEVYVVAVDNHGFIRILWWLSSSRAGVTKVRERKEIK